MHVYVAGNFKFTYWFLSLSSQSVTIKGQQLHCRWTSQGHRPPLIVDSRQTETKTPAISSRDIRRSAR